MATNFTIAGVEIGGKHVTASSWCKWHHDGTIQDDHNVSSITDNGTGNHYMNHDTDLATHYGAFTDCEANGKSAFNVVNAQYIQVLCRDEANAYTDRTYITGLAFTDPA